MSKHNRDRHRHKRKAPVLMMRDSLRFLVEYPTGKQLGVSGRLSAVRMPESDGNGVWPCVEDYRIEFPSFEELNQEQTIPGDNRSPVLMLDPRVKITNDGRILFVGPLEFPAGDKWNGIAGFAPSTVGDFGLSTVEEVRGLLVRTGCFYCCLPMLARVRAWTELLAMCRETGRQVLVHYKPCAERNRRRGRERGETIDHVQLPPDEWLDDQLHRIIADKAESN
jgi:hypothetical protein